MATDVKQVDFLIRNHDGQGESEEIGTPPLFLMQKTKGSVPTGFLLSLVFIGAILISGFWWFRRMERTFADVV